MPYVLYLLLKNIVKLIFFDRTFCIIEQDKIEYDFSKILFVVFSQWIICENGHTPYCQYGSPVRFHLCLLQVNVFSGK